MTCDNSSDQKLLFVLTFALELFGVETGNVNGIYVGVVMSHMLTLCCALAG